MYSKHKDALPTQTIEKIKGILSELHIEPTVKILKNTNGIYSAVLSDKKHGWYVNGKGTTEEYCMASAYGEAMERLQAYFAYNRLEEGEAPPEDQFLLYADEKAYDTACCSRDFPDIFEQFKNVYGIEEKRHIEEITDEELTEFLCRYFTEKTILVPYYDVKEDKITYLPEKMISSLCGSNGLSAGNTPREALNQGIAELLERHVKETIFRNELTPPDLPRQFLEEKMPELYETIIRVEEMGPYKIVIKDASMGVGMPVIAALFVDQSNQRYHVKFGASFSMYVAVERCLTELFQGFDLNDEASHEQLMTRWDVKASFNWRDPLNRQMQLKSDTGSIPISFIAGPVSWEFSDWDEDPKCGKSNFDNIQAFSFMIEKLKYFEPRIYIRDFSYLGFPSYRVFVPGVSYTNLPLGPKRMKYRIEKFSVDLLKKYPAVRLNENTIQECFDFLTGEENLVLEPFNDVPTSAVQAVFYYLFGQVEEARTVLCSMPEKHFGKKYQCAAMELELQLLGMEQVNRDQILSLFYEEPYVRFAKRAFRKDESRKDHTYLIDRVMDPQGKKLLGFGASDVPPVEREDMHTAIRARMRTNMPDQNQLRNLF